MERHPGEAAGDTQPGFSFEKELERLEVLDVRELDAAMRRVRRAMQQRQFRLGVALGEFRTRFRSVLQGFAAPTEPRWKALERMLEHVLAQFSADEPSFLYLRGEHPARI